MKREFCYKCTGNLSEDSRWCLTCGADQGEPIQNVRKGSKIQTRPDEDGAHFELTVMDNYWNRKHRLCSGSMWIPTIEIAAVLVGTTWTPVHLTPAQKRERSFVDRVRYNTSPESETYWCS